MKYTVALLFVGCAPLVAGPGRVLPSAMQYDPVSFERPITIERTELPRRLRLASGVEVMWSPEPAMKGLADVGLIVKCGRVDEPLGRAGLMQFTFSNVLASGGGAMDQVHGLRAARRFVSSPAIDDGESWYENTVLESELPDLLAHLTSAIVTPRIDAEVFERLRQSVLEGLPLPESKNALRASVIHRTAANGNLAALTQTMTEASVSGLTVEQLLAQARRCFAPNNLVLVLSGDLDEAKVRRLTDGFATWTGAPAPPRVVEHTPGRARQVWLAPIAGEPRVTVTIIGKGMPPGTLDRAGADILMAVVRQQLFSELRELLGAIYSVSADAEVGPGSGATWVRFTTRREVAHSAVLAASRIFQRWFEHWPMGQRSTDEVASSLRKFDRRRTGYQRTFDAARRLLVDGRPDEKPWDAQLANVHWLDLSALFTTFFRPDLMQIVVTGDVETSAPWADIGTPRLISE